MPWRASPRSVCVTTSAGGAGQGPHVHDLGLRDIADLLLRVKAQAYSVEAATPRHAYEWRLWEDIPLPEGKVLIPGVIAHTTAGGRASRNGSRAHHELCAGGGPGASHRGGRLWLCRGPCTSASTRPSCGPSSRPWCRERDSPRSACGGCSTAGADEGRRVPGKEPL